MTTQEPARPTRCILLVDDEPKVLEGLTRILRRTPWRVLTACSGQEALDRLAECPVDLVISDEQMPRLSGSELLAAVSRSHPEVRRVILTGKAMPEDIIRAINEGRVDRYLTKPVASERFLSTIREMLAERERDERMQALSSRAGGVCHMERDVVTGRDQWSPPAAAFFGRDEATPLKRLDDLWPWVADPDLPALRAAFEAAGERGESVSVEFRFLTPGGIPCWAGAVLEAVPGEDGTPARVLALFQDITGRKKDEADLLLAKAQAEAASKAKSEFLSTVSHELRTPLHIFAGMLDLLRSPVSEQETAQYLGLAMDSVERLTRIVDGMLEMADTEAQCRTPTPFPVAETLELSLESAMDQARTKGLGFTLRLDPDLPEILVGDGRAVGRVLALAAGNAVKFTDEGQVVVRAFFVGRTQGPGSLVLEVEDTGPGIESGLPGCGLSPPSPSRMAASGAGHGGVGLGLALLKKLVRLHGGSACLDSQPGQGTLLLASLAAATSIRRSPV